jgi:hypothetical protein
VDAFAPAVALYLALTVVAAIVVGVAQQPIAIAREVERSHRLTNLRRSRRHQGPDGFIAFLRGLGAPDIVAREAHRMLARDIVPGPEFPVLPADRLSDFCGPGRAGTVDAEDLVRILAGRCGLRVQVSRLDVAAPLTVRDLVLLVSAIYLERAQAREHQTLLRPTTPPVGVLLHPAAAGVPLGEQALLRPSDAR